MQDGVSGVDETHKDRSSAWSRPRIESEHIGNRANFSALISGTVLWQEPGNVRLRHFWAVIPPWKACAVVVAVRTPHRTALREPKAAAATSGQKKQRPAPIRVSGEPLAVVALACPIRASAVVRLDSARHRVPASMLS